MITNDGKEIIAKFLLGQVPAYATHLSIGCGATPLDAEESIPNSVFGKTMMDFEMTRVPISSKGFVDNSETYAISQKYRNSNIATLTTSVPHDIVIGETVIISSIDSTFNGQYRVTAIGPNPSAPFTTFSYANIGTNVNPAVAVSPNGTAIVTRTKMSLTAELPTDNRYDITEVGIWSAGGNSLTTQYDSRMIFNFTQSWKVHNTSISDPVFNTNLGDNGTTVTTDIQETSDAFYANTSDPIFQVNFRKQRKEGPRHLNKTLMVRGDLSTISPSAGGAWDSATKLKGDWVASGTHIHLNNISFDISGNNTSDLLKLAFSLVDKTAVAEIIPKDVKILMEFYKNEIDTENGYAKAQIYIPGTTFDLNRYHVSSFEISQNIDYSNESGLYTSPYTRFYTAPDFASSQIRVCRIFVSVVKADDSLSEDHYIALDGFRIENTTENPTYKMSGYSIVQKDGTPITKAANTNNYIDFRFALGVS